MDEFFPVYDLTFKQQMMADELWEIDSNDDLMAYIMSKPVEQRQEYRTVMLLLCLSQLDVIQDLSLAESMLANIGIVV